MKKIFCLLAVVMASLVMTLPTYASDFVWFDGQREVTYTVIGKNSPVVDMALKMFSDDMKMVTGQNVRSVYKSGIIRIVQLDEANKKTISSLRKENVPIEKLAKNMDAFYIHVGKDILIVGNNGRGTAYGLMELSRKAGVSPWIWWGDVIPEKKDKLTIEQGFTTLQIPSVEYRGIFLNDEDFALREWCDKTFEKGTKGTIGPKTYKKIYELLLRLHANTIWPGMHPGTTAFFKVPGNKEMADSFDIVVGTSHCEPMMRNNVGEWDVKRRGEYNYITNKDSVLNYWEERLQEVSCHPSSGAVLDKAYYYTLGMRGIHDGNMAGVKTMPEKVKGLNDVIADQRRLLAKYINNDVTKIPQIFVPYKEVLQIMESGVNVPEDVTLMWCDDNYGYLTRLSDAEQQKRPGGSGVYYHLSYWGQPHDYLWLTTTQPGLVYNEMKEAYDHNARKIWIANVHDPKVAAYDLSLFLDMAWDINSVSSNTIEKHLQDWLSLQFGSDVGSKLMPVMKEWYRLVGIRKPEFMGWCQTELDKKKYYRGWSPVIDTEFSITEFDDELDRYLKDYDTIVRNVDEIGDSVKPDLSDAYYAAVTYPVKASAAMSRKMLEAQKARRTGDEDAAVRAVEAHQQITDLTDYYNNEMSHGKWKYCMNCHPRNLLVYQKPVLTDTLLKADIHTILHDSSEYIARNACDYQSHDGDVNTVEMLGHSMKAVNITKGGSITYIFNVNSDGEAVLYTAMIPTQSNDKGDIRYSVSIDGGEPDIISLKESFRSPQWKLNVLRGQALVKTPLMLTRGSHSLTIKAIDNHIVADQWMIDFSKERKFYLIPVAKN